MRKYSKEVDFLFIYFTFSEVKFSKKRHLHVKGGGGFRPVILETLSLRCELKGEARTRPYFLGLIWNHAHNFTHLRPRSKNGAKHQNIIHQKL